MSYRDYMRKRREDPEYQKVEKRLKPILDLADDIIHLRLEKGWTQKELARRVKTKQANISRLENGLANPTFKFLQRLSKVFGTDLTVRLRPQPTETQVAVVYFHSDKRYSPLCQELDSSITQMPDITAELSTSPQECVLQ